MAKRGRKRVTEPPGKRRRSEEENEQPENVDTTVYEVERIVSQRVVNGDVQYFLKWKGYSKEENTWEYDLRVNTPELLHKYAKTVLDKDYNDFITIDIGRNNMSDRYFLETLNPLSILCSNFLSLGSIRYVTQKSVETKKKMLKTMIDFEQEYAMRTICKCTDEELQEDFERYITELTHRLQSAIDYPTVSIAYAFLAGESPKDTVTLPPPPLGNIIFEDIPSDLVGHDRIKIAPKSANLGFGGGLPFIHRDYFNNFKFASFETHPKFAFLFNKSEFKAKQNPRFYGNFTLRFDNESLGWVISINHNIDRGRPLLPLAGIVTSVSDAAKSMTTDGAAIALVSFIKLTGSKKCLDRRRFYDFSRFIKHSCDPNCGVKLLKNDNFDYPKLVVYAKGKLTAGDTLTMNYFKCFEKEIDAFFVNKKLSDGQILTGEDYDNRLIYLHEHKIAHVICACDSHLCKKILYVKSNSSRFEGLDLADDSSVFTINNFTLVDKKKKQ